MHASYLTSPLSLDPTSNSDSYNSIINSNNNNINSCYNKPNNYLARFLITALILGLGLLFQSFRSKYFAATAAAMSAGAGNKKGCALCGEPSKLWCSACKIPYYCSQTCQSEHWKSEHKANCKGSSGRLNSQQHKNGKRSLSIALVPLPPDKIVSQQHKNGKRNSSIALVPLPPDKIVSQQHKNGKRNSSIALVPLPPDKIVDKVLFSYDVFIKLFNWDLPTFVPCGLLNCGNSCFANVVLQCLSHTRPLMAYLLKKAHRKDCRRSKWCFLCEFEAHVERATSTQKPFSPINILSHLPTMGGNMGYGRQHDAHEFLRFAIDMMQSACLDKHGGEKLIHPKSQETTLIQHIFGGQTRSQVKCTRCGQVSDRYENMMDLFVEIDGDVTSLQEGLDQFTEIEWLCGENMYQCNRCEDYVDATKRVTIHQAPNILTVTLKRFQGGNFGKINKKVTFSESLDLSPFMSEKRDGADTYELYAVVVHMDLLNASYFGHYICYTKGFQGDWYWIDDRKVTRVDVDEVLSQGAYMLFYKRISARPKCLKTCEVGMEKEREGDKRATTAADDICQSQLPSSSSSSDLCMNEREGEMATVADDIFSSRLPSSSNSSDPCTNMECEGDQMATVADDSSPSQLPNSFSSNSSDPCMNMECEGDKMATVADNISPSQLPTTSSSNSSDPCMNIECEGDKMATVADDISQIQLPTSSSSNLCLSNFTTTDEKKQLEPLDPLSLAVREAINRVSEHAFPVLPMSDECNLSEPAFNKNQPADMDPKGESSDADQVEPRYSINGSESLLGQRSDKKE